MEKKSGSFFAVPIESDSIGEELIETKRNGHQGNRAAAVVANLGMLE